MVLSQQSQFVTSRQCEGDHALQYVHPFALHTIFPFSGSPGPRMRLAGRNQCVRAKAQETKVQQPQAQHVTFAQRDANSVS